MGINATKTKPGHLQQGIQRPELPVIDSGSETGNKVITPDLPCRELYVANDSLENNLTIVVSGEADLSLSFTLYPNETFNERLPEFTTITVTATDGWRWYVRSGRIP